MKSLLKAFLASVPLMTFAVMGCGTDTTGGSGGNSNGGGSSGNNTPFSATVHGKLPGNIMGKLKFNRTTVCESCNEFNDIRDQSGSVTVDGECPNHLFIPETVNPENGETSEVQLRGGPAPNATYSRNLGGQLVFQTVIQDGALVMSSTTVNGQPTSEPAMIIQEDGSFHGESAEGVTPHLVIDGTITDGVCQMNRHVVANGSPRDEVLSSADCP